MRDIISILFFQRNKYRSKSKSIHDKDHIHQSENISISQYFITCVFHNLPFLTENMYQKYTKIGKFKKYLGTQNRSYFILFYSRNRDVIKFKFMII